MKVLLVNGSPHEKGCTHEALNEVNALEREGIHANFLMGISRLRDVADAAAARHKIRYDDRDASWKLPAL
ncbi:MAG: hypothetical protein ACLUOI_18455 [Eisenbergiella sp.]